VLDILSFGLVYNTTVPNCSGAGPMITVKEERVYNRASLAINVTSSCSLTVFKSRLKTHIFRQTFNLSD